MENPRAANAIEVLSLTRRFGSLVAVGPLNVFLCGGSDLWIAGSERRWKKHADQELTTLLLPSEGTAKIAGCDLVRTSGGRAAEDWIRLADVVPPTAI